MLVKMNIGKYKGEIRDIEPKSALGLIARGEASHPVYEQQPVISNDSPLAVAQPLADASKASRRGRR
jgi:hypothetical protein